MKSALSFPPTPTELLALATHSLNDAAERSGDSPTGDYARTQAEVAHGAATLLLVAKLEEIEQRYEERATRAELRRAKLDTATDEILEKAKPMLLDQIERMGQPRGPVALRREEILAVLSEHDAAKDPAVFTVNRDQLEELVDDLLGETREIPEIPTSGNGVYEDAGKWWVDLARAETPVGNHTAKIRPLPVGNRLLPKCCLGPFDLEAEADAAASYAFATYIATGNIPTTLACLANIRAGRP